MLSRPLLFLALLAAAADAGAQVRVRAHQKVSDTRGGLAEPLDSGGRFGLTLASLGDLDGDGVGDLAVGAEGDVVAGQATGALFLLFLASDGTVLSHQRIDEAHGGFGGALDAGDRFASAVASLGDLDGPGPAAVTLAVGALGDAGPGGANLGAVWILWLASDGTLLDERRIAEGAGGFGGDLDDADWFGVSLASLGDLDGAGPAATALAVGALRDDDGGTDRGAVWILFLDGDGSVLAERKISDAAGGFTGELDDLDHFGRKVAALGDLGGDGRPELAVSAPGDDDGGEGRGAVWILSLEPDGSVAAHAKISTAAGCFAGVLDDGDQFGRGLAALGDLDGDGSAELGVGASHDDDGGSPPSANRGALWILSLAGDGSVLRHAKISQEEGGFTGALDDQDVFGVAACALGDHDGDGSADLAVGAIGDDDGGANHGAFYALFLEPAPADLGDRLCCPAVPNSTGVGGVMRVRGSAVVADDDLVLEARRLPPEPNVGYFVMGTGQNVVTPPGSAGPLCVLPGLLRIRPPVSDTSELDGGFRRVVGTSGPVTGAITSGSAWSFQAWHRDSMAPSNLTDAVRVVFQ